MITRATTAEAFAARRASRLIASIIILTLVIAVPARSQITELELPHPADPTFGVSVALDGRRALVGASGEATCGPNAGAAYLFELDTTGTWRFVARLVPHECQPGSYFGRTLDLSGDRALVGASSEYFASEVSDIAYVFERTSDGTWQETAQLRSMTQHDEGPFAACVALDGPRALITTWGDVERDPPADGAAYLYEYRSRRWSLTTRLTEPVPTRGVFGGGCALDSARAVVAASTYDTRGTGSAFVFENPDGTEWQVTGHLSGIEAFFIDVDIYGERVLVGAPRTGQQEVGRALLFARDTKGTWHRQAVLQRRRPFPYGAFGTAVSLGPARTLITGYDEQLDRDVNIDRVVYVFAPNRAGTWHTRQVIDIGEPTFGSALDHDGDLALVGNARHQSPGAAYIVQLH